MPAQPPPMRHRGSLGAASGRGERSRVSVSGQHEPRAVFDLFVREPLEIFPRPMQWLHSLAVPASDAGRNAVSCGLAILLGLVYVCGLRSGWETGQGEDNWTVAVAQFIVIYIVHTILAVAAVSVTRMRSRRQREVAPHAARPHGQSIAAETSDSDADSDGGGIIAAGDSAHVALLASAAPVGAVADEDAAAALWARRPLIRQRSRRILIVGAAACELLAVVFLVHRAQATIIDEVTSVEHWIASTAASILEAWSTLAVPVGITYTVIDAGSMRAQIERVARSWADVTTAADVRLGTHDFDVQCATLKVVSSLHGTALGLWLTTFTITGIVMVLNISGSRQRAAIVAFYYLLLFVSATLCTVLVLVASVPNNSLRTMQRAAMSGINWRAHAARQAAMTEPAAGRGNSGSDGGPRAPASAAGGPRAQPQGSVANAPATALPVDPQMEHQTLSAHLALSEYCRAYGSRLQFRVFGAALTMDSVGNTIKGWAAGTFLALFKMGLQSGPPTG